MVPPKIKNSHCIWNSMLIKLRLQCIGNVCCVLVYSQSVYSTQLCVHTEQWIHNFGLTPVLAQILAVWSIPNSKKKIIIKKKKKNAPWRANFREPRSTALYPNPRYNEARYNEGRLYFDFDWLTLGRPDRVKSSMFAFFVSANVAKLFFKLFTLLKQICSCDVGWSKFKN